MGQVFDQTGTHRERLPQQWGCHLRVAALSDPRIEMLRYLQRTVGNRALNDFLRHSGLSAHDPSSTALRPIVQRSIVFNNQSYDETAMTAGEMQNLWQAVRDAQPQPADAQTIAIKLQHVYLARFGHTLQAGINTGGQAQGSQLPLQAAKVDTAEQSKALRTTLTDWIGYVNRCIPVLQGLQQEIAANIQNGRNDLAALGEQTGRAMLHLQTCGQVCGRILLALPPAYTEASPADRFAVLGLNAGPEAVIMWNNASRTEVADMTTNPRNIVPDVGQIGVVKQVAAALLALTIEANKRAHGGTPTAITLTSANNLVQQMYEAFGFAVTSPGGQQYPYQQALMQLNPGAARGHLATVTTDQGARDQLVTMPPTFR